MIRRAAAAALLLAASGCASVDICDVGGHTMAVVQNSGWYFLNFIPLGSGDPDSPNSVSCVVFGGTVTLENNLKMLERAREEAGATECLNVTSYTKEESVCVTIRYRMPTVPVSRCSVRYEVYGDGTVETTLDYPAVKGLPEMPEFGMLFRLNADLDRVIWYGLGPCSRARGSASGSGPSGT